MNAWKLLDRAHVPGSNDELLLYQRGDEFSIMAERSELMNSRTHASEDALARFACARVADRPNPHILIGGLGMGFTLAAALRQLGTKGHITVAELVPEVIAWNRGPLAHLAGRPLDDARVTIRQIDVVQLLQTEHRHYDAILLDVDNGPEGLTRSDNDWLYTAAGLKAALGVLRPHGLLAVWSAFSDPVFAQRLHQAGFAVEEIRVRARGLQGRRHRIWLAGRDA